MAGREATVKNLLTRNVETILRESHLARALRAGKRLRIKHGIDPTGERIHIGRAVALWKLREFQELGHTVVLIIGDFTAQIGDPSDKLEKRPFLTKAQIKKNLKTYLPQIGTIVNLKKAEVHHNSTWLSKLDFQEISRLADLFTVQQMLRRRNFSARWENNQDISLREFMYPLMQGYDSVAVKADVEVGGSDQLFNLLAGRKIQEHYGQKPQDIVTTKMLLGLDGRKMSTTWGNVVNIADPPDEQYGKLMSMHDDMIVHYFELATDVDEKTVASYRKELTRRKTNPKVLKEKLAYEAVRRYHGATEAGNAAKKFEQLFSKRETKGKLPELTVSKRKVSLVDLVTRSDAVKSRSEAWRLITQGGLKIDGKVKRNPREEVALRGRETLRIGKKHFFRVKILK